MSYLYRNYFGEAQRKARMSKKFEIHGEAYVNSLLNDDFSSWLDFGLNQREAPRTASSSVRGLSYQIARSAHSKQIRANRSVPFIPHLKGGISSDR